MPKTKVVEVAFEMDQRTEDWLFTLLSQMEGLKFVVRSKTTSRETLREVKADWRAKA